MLKCTYAYYVRNLRLDEAAYVKILSSNEVCTSACLISAATDAATIFKSVLYSIYGRFEGSFDSESQKECVAKSVSLTKPCFFVRFPYFVVVSDFPPSRVVVWPESCTNGKYIRQLAEWRSTHSSPDSGPL